MPKDIDEEKPEPDSFKTIYERIPKIPYGKLEEIHEEQVKQEFLPIPQTKRITRTHGYTPPAEQHRDAISKAMKGKGGSARYRKTIKTSPKIKIEEEENQ